MANKIFNYLCPECGQKSCSISKAPEKIICSCGIECDLIGTEEDEQAIKPDFDHIDFKSSTKPECVLEGKKCGIMNHSKNVCIIELEPFEFYDINSGINKTMRKFTLQTCGEKNAEPILFEEVID